MQSCRKDTFWRKGHKHTNRTKPKYLNQVVTKTGISEYDFPNLHFFGNDPDITIELVQKDSHLQQLKLAQVRHDSLEVGLFESRIFAYHLN